jgi:PKD repeat protein
MIPRSQASLIVLSALALLSACGGGGGGGGGSPTPPPINNPPVASFTANPSSGTAPLTVQFDGSASTDADGSIASYSWNFGDGSAAGAGVTTGHLYPSAGTYTVTLRVSDDLGASGTSTQQVIVSPGPPSPIRATVMVPTAGMLVPDTVSIAVTVVSTYEVSSVTASLAGNETALTFSQNAWPCKGSPDCPGFAGTLSLAGQPTGPYTLRVRAEDVRGNVDEVAVSVVHDNPPRLTWTEPLDLSVALPTLPLAARCDDDLPGCIVELWVNDTLRESATSALGGPLDLSGWMNHRVDLQARVRDSAGQSRSETRTAFVADEAKLAVVAELPGEILDADTTRLLYVERGDDGDTLAIYDRADSSTEVIPLPAARDVRGSVAYLTPGGAMFVAQARDGSVLTSRLYWWHLGTLADLAYPDSAVSLAVSGNYAIWNESTDLHRLDTQSGARALVSSGAGNVENSVAADGTVVFWNRSYQIVRDRAGFQTTLTSDTSQWHVYPLTDGERVVYRRQDPCCANQQFAIVLLEADVPLVLAEKRDRDPQPGRDYQLSGGWAAYTDLGNVGQLHVFTRSPQGIVTRHTDFGTSSDLDLLAGNGEVMVFGRGLRYLSRGGGLVELSSADGRGYWLDGAWHVALGRVLLSVDAPGG